MTLNLANKRFGRVVVTSKTNNRVGASIVWGVKCDCGVSTEISARDLVTGKRKGCGQCYDTKHPLYSTWIGMIQRCSDLANKDYGGRGITVCEEWKNNFLVFIADMGTKPSEDHSVDRIDNNAGYSKSNCKWSTPEEQSNNKRDLPRKLTDTNVITIYNATGSNADIANLFNVAYKTVANIRALSYSQRATELCLHLRMPSKDHSDTKHYPSHD